VRIGLEAAGGKNLEVFSPTIGKLLLRLGVIDEFDLHLAPVLLGDGIRLYDAPGTSPRTCNALIPIRHRPSASAGLGRLRIRTQARDGAVRARAAIGRRTLRAPRGRRRDPLPSRGAYAYRRRSGAPGTRLPADPRPTGLSSSSNATSTMTVSASGRCAAPAAATSVWVTSLVFRTLPAPATTVFHLVWPPAIAAAVVRAWQAYAPDALEELDATLRLTAAGDDGRQPWVEVVGSVLDCEPTPPNSSASWSAGWAPTR
jgi:hypothetical protein